MRRELGQRKCRTVRRSFKPALISFETDEYSIPLRYSRQLCSSRVFLAPFPGLSQPPRNTILSFRSANGCPQRRFNLSLLATLSIFRSSQNSNNAIASIIHSGSVRRIPWMLKLFWSTTNFVQFLHDFLCLR